MGDSRREPKTRHARRVGNSDVWVLPGPPGFGRVRLPMPPSVNVRQRPVMRVRSTALGPRAGLELALTAVVRDYYANAVCLRVAWKWIMAAPIEDFVKMRFAFYLGNPLYDTHNGLKVACDLIQMSGLVLNDRYILPQVEAPENAPADPRLIITFPLPAAPGPGPQPGSTQGTP